MRETQRNIRTYKKKLIGLKEKLATAGLLFLMSAVMLTTASFAWITLSVAPEVKGIATTVSGNGNLEIALAHTSEDGILYEPPASAAGDSNLPLVERNATWGNLINLNDPSYGLERVTLKPATLYESDLVDSPLIGVTYGSDGRVFDDFFDFKYSNFNPLLNNNKGEFEVPQDEKLIQYGVRAISSASRSTDNTAVVQASEKLSKAQRQTGEYYLSIMEEHKDILADIIGKFVSDKARSIDKIGDGKKADYRSDMPHIIHFFEDFLTCIESGFELYDLIAKEQYSGDPDDFPYKSIDEMIQKGEVGLRPSITEMKGLDVLIGMYNQITSDLAELNVINNDTTTYPVINFEHISDQVNYIVKVDDCWINEKYRVGSISGSVALDMLPEVSGGGATGKITKGALVDFEKTIGETISLDVTIKSYMGFNSLIGMYPGVNLDTDKNLVIQARVFTSANKPYHSDLAIAGVISKLNQGKPIVWKADDVYGLVLDLWVRTNIDSSYLTLEGEPVTQTLIRTIIVGDKEYIVYRNTISGMYYYHVPANDQSYSSERVYDETIDLTANGPYLSDEEINYLLSGDIFNLSTGQKVEFTNDDNNDNRKLFINELYYDKKTIIIGYDGVNRVWQESSELSDNSATQGRGSCYIFYPTDPIEQEKTLQLLKGFRIAFLDGLNDNKLLTIAKLNTEYAYEENGKVTVPIELDPSRSGYYLQGEERVFYISEMEKNTSHLISAIVYIDGKEITNEDVQSTNNITGYLNLQFGSSEMLVNLEDEEVKRMEYSVVGTLGDDNSTSLTLDFDGNNLPTAKVNISVEGVTPSNVSVSFVKKVNDNQGVKTEEVFLYKSGENWTGNVTFERPGDYVLRSAWIDGVEYDFSDDEVLTVTVKGLNIASISWLDEYGNDDSKIYYMGSNYSYTTSVTTVFDANDTYAPEEVSALFRNDDNNTYVTVKLRKREGFWSGSGTFIRSGTYTLETIMIDGEAQTVPEGMKKTVTLYLGINAEITAEPNSVVYEGESIYVDVTAQIYDGDGALMNDLTNTFIKYNLVGNSSKYLLSELEWNEEKSSYIGQFHVEKPGTYKFSFIGINKEIITDIDKEWKSLSSYLETAKAPTINLIPKAPPSYVRNNTNENQFAPNDDAVFSIDISNSSTAIGAVVMTNTSTNPNQTITFTIPELENIKDTPEGSSITTWNIPVGTLQGSSQNGNWRLDKIYLSNVVVNEHLYVPLEDESGNYIWDEQKNNKNFLVFDLSSEKISTYVLNDVKISLTNSSNTEFTKNAVPFTNSLSGSYTRTNTLSITDWWGNSIDSLLKVDPDKIKLRYEHDIGDYDKWWPTWQEEAKETISPLVGFVKGTNSNVYTSKNNAVFYYPGTYNSRLEIEFADANQNVYGYVIDSATSIKSETVKFVTVTNFVQNEEIKWAQPYVKYTGVNPGVNTGISVYAGHTGGFMGIGAKPTYETLRNSYTDYEVNAYFKAQVSSRYFNSIVGKSSATITLYSAGNSFSQAKCILNESTESVFVFSDGANTATAPIGSYKTKSAANDEYYSIAGASCNLIVFTYTDSKTETQTTYSFTLQNPISVGQNR